jgi:L-asparaginase II
MNNSSKPAKLVEYIRDGLAEQEHFGYIVKYSKDGKVEKIGEDNNTPFYLRSCAKPLQASLLIDLGLDTAYNMTLEEIALCCASHAGEKVHTTLVSSILSKFGLSERYLKCGEHPPISRSAQDKLLREGKKAGQIHNNCSGKHAMMLGLCKLKGWDLKTYDDINHPLQQEIKRKIYELCELESQYPITKDGCGVPIHSMPMINIAKGYLNIFCNPKYEKIKNAFLDYPYLIGGENRTDTKIIQNNTSTIVAKVGAGGLIAVVNTQKEECFVVKICDANMDAREIVAIDYINKLGWGKINLSHDIKTNHGDIVGQIKTFL